MKQPIIIDAPIEFALIGPIREGDGILVRSSKLDYDLIGLSHYIYKLNEEFTREEDIKQILRSENINHIWSNKKIRLGNRRNNLLFCWKSVQYKDTSRQPYSYLLKNKNVLIQENFDDFLVDTFRELIDFMEKPNANVNINEKIKWNIAPFLIQCYYRTPLKKI